MQQFALRERLKKEIVPGLFHPSILTKKRSDILLEIRPIQTVDEALDIFKFRYRIYVSEMKRQEPYANHDDKTLFEPLDSKAELIGVYRDGRLVGTGRLNFFGSYRHDLNEDILEFRRFEEQYDNRIMFISRLMIEPGLRNTLLFLDLCQFIFARSIEEGIEVGLQ